MRKIAITIANSGTTYINTESHETWHEEDGITVDFFLGREGIREKEYLPAIRNQVRELTWITCEGNKFYFNLSIIKELYSSLFESCSWMKGEIEIPYTNDIDLTSDNIPIVSFSASKEEIESNFPKKIFLSHRGSNKEMVREYFSVLKELGYEPWLDEDAMAAGITLDRGILEGMKDSCACVFFITPEYKDNGYLEDEINYAKMANREKGNKFTIITLELKDEKESDIDIPDLLKPYVWKKPSSSLEALREIVRALPISLGKTNWRR
ncbi:toll/interleukin-1 receptor domain-containing protein [Priestia megaterium]|uniref:toll/interleukin-1 receptor domain-containing protein n=1 Tax=Priestia megaterium TaxID=1404 RepID=UPI002D7E8903|nr:toll/interleukin-1 receptor domain-containing protein [Priestia megaterium]MEB4870178.1 toll/interleukin-1 receptor domain-containing protein [Priestia megaterium]